MRSSFIGPASATAASSFACGTRAIASLVKAGIFFSAANAASRRAGVVPTDSTSHTYAANGSAGGDGSAP
jgi:hypothetical protein